MPTTVNGFGSTLTAAQSLADPWGSESTNKTLAPPVAIANARLMAIVVLPEPPF